MFGFGYRRKKAPEARQKPYRDLHDWLSLVVNTLGLLAVVYTIAITLRSNAESGKDMARAIGEMRDIAVAMKDQKPLIAQQAKAAADAASAAKDTAAAARGQTTAIIRQADAQIKGAQAVVTATAAQFAAAQAQTDAARSVAETAVPVARFAGVSFENQASSPDKDGLIVFKVRPFFVNIGSVYIIPSPTTFHIIFAAKLPTKPIIRNTLIFGANELAIPPGQGYGPDGIELTMTVKQRDGVMDGSLKIFGWGVTYYTGSKGGTLHKKCFADELVMKKMDAATATIRRIDEPAYQCPDV